MTHEKITDQLEEYVLGTLPDDEHRAVETHLGSECKECRERVRELSETLARMADSVPQVDPPADLKARIMESVSGTAVAPIPTPERDTGSSVRGSWGIRWVALVSTAAGIALAVWGGSSAAK